MAIDVSKLRRAARQAVWLPELRAEVRAANNPDATRRWLVEIAPDVRRGELSRADADLLADALQAGADGQSIEQAIGARLAQGKKSAGLARWGSRRQRDLRLAAEVAALVDAGHPIYRNAATDPNASTCATDIVAQRYADVGVSLKVVERAFEAYGDTVRLPATTD